MKVKALIETLSHSKPDDVVKIYDPDAEEVLPVTGLTFGGTDGGVHLYSDE